MKLQINNLPHKNKLMARIRLPLLLRVGNSEVGSYLSPPNSFLLYDKISPVILSLAKDLTPLAADLSCILHSKTEIRLSCVTLLTA
jgi:hypothetical protein